MRVSGVSDSLVPYFTSIYIDIEGSGLFGVREVWFVSSDGERRDVRGVAGVLASDRVRVRTPAPYERWGAATVIVSEGDASYNQRDTLDVPLRFVGPVPSDTLVYEFRF